MLYPRETVSFVIYVCHHFICKLPAWNKNFKWVFLLFRNKKINRNDISSLFIAPARPKTKPTPIYDATGKLLVTSTTITIRMPICYYNDDHGPIRNVQVLVTEAGGIIKCQLTVLNCKEEIAEWFRNFSSKLVIRDWLLIITRLLSLIVCQYYHSLY